MTSSATAAGLLIAGVGRSGTSIASRMAIAAGLRPPAGADLMQPTAGNPDGYWESTSLALLNDRLLADLGASWWTPPAAVDLTRLLAHHPAAESAFRATFGAGPGWVFKDPRLSMLVRFWLDVLGDQPVLVPMRRPQEVALSIAHRDEVTYNQALAIWVRQTRLLLDQLAGRRVLVLDYRTMVDNPDSWQAALIDFCADSGLTVGRHESAAGLVHPPTTSGGDAPCPSHVRRLAETVHEVIGAHRNFPRLDLGSEPPEVADTLAGIDVRAVAATSSPRPTFVARRPAAAPTAVRLPTAGRNGGDPRIAATNSHDVAHPGDNAVLERFDPGDVLSGLTGAEHLLRYRTAAEFVQSRRVLDIACGSGYGSRLLADAGAGSVLGVDADPDSVRAATDKYGGDGVEFAHASIYELPDEWGTFDVIVCLETLEHLPDPAAALAQLHRRLAPDGLLICSTPNAAEEFEDNPYHIVDFDAERFRTLLAAEFPQVAVYAQRRTVGTVLTDPRSASPTAPDLGAMAAEPTSHFLGVASDGPLPMLGAAVRLAGADDLRFWIAQGHRAGGLEADLRAAQDELTRVNAARGALEQEHLLLRQTYSELERGYGDLERAIADLRAALAEGQAVTTSLQAEKARIEATVELAEHRARDAAAQLATVEKTLATKFAIEEELLRRVEQLAPAAEQGLSAPSTIAALEDALERSRQDLQNVQSTVSWRTTRGMRALRALHLRITRKRR